MQKISDVTTAGCECVSEDDSIVSAAQKMRQHGIGALPVRNRENKLTGMLTDRDIVLEVVAAERDPTMTTAHEIASAKPVSVRANEPIARAIEMMKRHRVRRLPVVDENEAVVGLISLGDIATSADNGQSGALLEEVSSDTPAAAS